MSDHTRHCVEYRDALMKQFDMDIADVRVGFAVAAYERGWFDGVRSLEAENTRLREAIQSSLQIIRVAWSNQECAEARAILQAALSPAQEEPTQ